MPDTFYTRFLLPAILLLYFGLSLHQLDLPGLHYDEAFEAVPALQLLLDRPVTAFRGSGLMIGGRLWPLMTQDYIGALNTYLALPFIYMLGPTPLALRFPPVIIGIITLLLTFWLTRQLTGSAAAGLVAAGLLAVEPTFIFWNRQGIFVTAITAPVGLGATLCWLRRFQGGGRGWSLAGGFLTGVGLYAKLLFIWLIGAWLGAAIVLFGPRLPARYKQAAFKPVELGLIGLAFLLGCWPLLLYNLQTGGTLLNISQNAQTSYYGVNNLALGPNLIERWRQFTTLLSGGHLWYLGQIKANPLPWPVFVLFLVSVLIIIFTTRNQRGGQPSIRLVLFPFLVISLIIIASIQTVSALWITHFALLMPWPASAIAVSGWFINRQLGSDKRPGWGIRGIVGLGVGLVLISNLGNTLAYHRALTTSGGLSSHSDAVYDLSRWLTGHATGPVVAMDWGLAAPVTYLSGGQISPVEVFGYAWQPDQTLDRRLRDFVQQPGTLYLWRTPDEVIFDRSGEFKAFYRPLDLQENIEAAFYERSGRPLLGVTRLVPQGTATQPP